MKLHEHPAEQDISLASLDYLAWSLGPRGPFAVDAAPSADEHPATGTENRSIGATEDERHFEPSTGRYPPGMSDVL